MNIEAVLLSVLIVLLSAILKSGITNTGGTAATAWEIGLGLPVDLSFVAFSLVLTATAFIPEVEQYQTAIAVTVLVLAVIQLIFLYRPSKGYYESKSFGKAFGVFALNAILTFVCLSAVLFKVLAL
ncbi:hypothetical protein ACYVMA_004538 [Vibrio parahaemolyticus]